MPSLDLTQASREDILRLCEINLAAFALEFLSGPDDAPYFGEFLVGRHHQEWADIAFTAVSQAEKKETRGSQVLVQASRDFGKSYFWTFALPIWYAWRLQRRVGKAPPGTVHLQLLSSTKSKANALLKMVATEIMTNDKLAELRPDENVPRHLRVWGQEKIELRNGFIIAAAGYHTAVRSGHPLIIILDDVLIDQAKYSALIRKKDVEFFNGAVFPMLRPGGCLFLIGTPMHSKDLYAEKRKTGMFVESYTPALTEDGESNWPEVYSTQWIEDRRRSINNEIEFQREYLLRLVDDLSSYFPASIFEKGQDDTLLLGESLEYYEERYGPLSVFHGVDLAMTAGPRSDSSVIFTYGLAENGRRIVMNIEEYQTEHPSEHMQRIETAWRRYGGVVTIESNQGQRMLGVDMRDNTEVPINLHTTGTEKHSMSIGLPSLKISFETGRWVWPLAPDGDDFTRADPVTKLFDQFTGFSFVEGRLKSTRDHDDLPMALWLADQGRLQLSPGGSDMTTVDVSPAAVAETLEEYFGPADSALDDYFGLGVEGLPGVDRQNPVDPLSEDALARELSTTISTWSSKFR